MNDRILSSKPLNRLDSTLIFKAHNINLRLHQDFMVDIGCWRYGKRSVGQGVYSEDSDAVIIRVDAEDVLKSRAN
jgi:hypothetical protein